MKRTNRIIAAGILSLGAFCLTQYLPSNALPRNADAMERAGAYMDQAIRAIRELRTASGAAFDPALDPNRTGLIGAERSPLVTTLGELEAKRTTTNPNMAGFIAWLFAEAGVKPGDQVAIGSSGSFPALLLASLAAAKALDARPITILSLGASSYGATDPDFNLLDIYEVLMRLGICTTAPAAVSLGGENDVGSDLEATIRDRLASRIQTDGIPFLREPDLRRNVSERLRIYRSAASGKIAAFINSGGGYANLGTSTLVLEVRPGLNTDLPLPAESARGVLYAMAALKVPVIHLLFVKGLVTQAGLPWDPIPLPKPDVIRPPGAPHTTSFWVLSAAYFTLLVFLAFFRR